MGTRGVMDRGWLTPAPARRADAGTVRLTGRDVAGLTWCANMYGALYDLLAACLAVREDRLRAITARYVRYASARCLMVRISIACLPSSIL